MEIRNDKIPLKQCQQLLDIDIKCEKFCSLSASNKVSVVWKYDTRYVDHVCICSFIHYKQENYKSWLEITEPP